MRPLILILLTTILIHLPYLSRLTTFSGDQGYDFLKIKEILEGNFTLLGPRIGPYTEHATLYLGPFYYYLLAPFLLLYRMDPIGASFAILLSRLATVILIYFVTKKLFSKGAAIISALTAAVSPLWANTLGFPSNPYFIPPITLLIILILLSKSKSHFTYLGIGILAGLNIQLHYLSVFLIPAVLFYMFLKRSLRLKTIAVFLLGIIVGILPVILFEIRNQFFLTNQFLSLLRASPLTQNLNFQFHYFANLYPLLLILTGHSIYSSKKVHKLLPAVLTLLLIIVLLKSNNFSSSSGYTMPKDLNLKQIKKISRTIANDAGQETFNVTSTLDGDSRAMPYRYLVQVYGKSPLDIEHYDSPQNLYIITRDPKSSVRESSLFEIASFQPSYVEGMWNFNGDIKLIKLTKQKMNAKKIPKFITIVNPVRARVQWNDNSIDVIKKQIEQVKSFNLKATWLLQYDNLFDQEVTDLFKSQDKNQEIGSLLEVSEKWATDSHVLYKIADGDYYRPDKVFLSGYVPYDRKKLIYTYFKKFEQIFGRQPQSVGAWYIDANSHQHLEKLGVTSAITLSDQFDTDAASIWGKYFAMPFYPSKANSLVPAQNQDNKVPIVNIQWAQRDPVLSYGADILDSRQSFQANDYINNGHTTPYFSNLLENYLANEQNDFMQLTIGLEAGQEAVLFGDEFARQLTILEQYQQSGEISALTMADFAAWYRDKYPGVSPSHLLKKEDSFWYMSPKFRLAIFKEGDNFVLKDLRYYSDVPFDDFYQADANPYLTRNTKEQIDQVKLGNQIHLGESESLSTELHFDRLKIMLDNSLVEINTKGILKDGEPILKNELQSVTKKSMRLLGLKETAKSILGVFKYSKIEGKVHFGVAFGSNLYGFAGASPGKHSYPYQVISRFKSPASLVF